MTFLQMALAAVILHPLLGLIGVFGGVNDNAIESRSPAPAPSPSFLACSAAASSGGSAKGEESCYDDGLAFIHVAKAGGSSLRSFFSDLAKECGYNYISDEYPMWKEMTDTERSNVQLYAGTNHLGYFDLLRSWPGNHTNTAFFTQLREPLRRVISDYYYIKGLGDVHHSYAKVKDMNVTEWIRYKKDGRLLSYFASIAEGDDSQRDCCFNASDLEEGKSLLSRFAVVGLVEEPQMTMDVLKCRVPWIRRAVLRNPKLATIPHLNERSIAYEDNSTDIDGKTEFPLDTALYEFARELLYENYEDCKLRGML